MITLGEMSTHKFNTSEKMFIFVTALILVNLFYLQLYQTYLVDSITMATFEQRRDTYPYNWHHLSENTNGHVNIFQSTLMQTTTLYVESNSESPDNIETIEQSENVLHLNDSLSLDYKWTVIPRRRHLKSKDMSSFKHKKGFNPLTIVSNIIIFIYTYRLC